MSVHVYILCSCVQSIPNYLIIIIYSKLFNYYLFILIFVEPSLVISPFKLWTNHSSWLRQTHFGQHRIQLYLYRFLSLEMAGLESLSDRRSKRCHNFSLKAIKHQRNSRFVPLKQNAGTANSRNSETLKVNFALTSQSLSARCF